ncbi:hypothetical protein [Micromonospora sp. NPDC051141]|uniref:hypothetical protein n=1 Tax=Micromonospora sp. NPDC051141 TaxID=3364284 RepID=UPI00379F764C
MRHVADGLVPARGGDRVARRIPAAAPVPEFCVLNVDDLLNNRGTTGIADTDHGRLNVWGNSFPAEELPEPGALITVDGVPFRWPRGHVDGDNVRCEGQVIDLPSGRYEWVYLLAASERRSEDTLWVFYDDGHADPLPLGVSDFLDGTPVFGEKPAFRTGGMHYPHHVQPNLPTTMWSCRVGVPRRGNAHALRLPRLVALHVFAVTLLTSADARAADGSAR